MARDAREFILACLVCAVGKLRLLPIPSRPWSHIAMDFVTGLPPSNGNTMVLTMVDRFSMAVHFIPLPKLPSARETVVTVFDHVFRIHGLPVYVVSNRGPQFTSRHTRQRAYTPVVFCDVTYGQVWLPILGIRALHLPIQSAHTQQ